LGFELLVEDLEPRGGSDEEKKTGVYNVFVFVVEGMIVVVKKEKLKSKTKNWNTEGRL
jgi:glyoxylate utilization-related uncharacterized protein